MRHPGLPALLMATLVAGAVGMQAQSDQTAATVVGQETCATCHEDVAKQFDRSTRGALPTSGCAGSLRGAKRATAQAAGTPKVAVTRR